MNDHDFLAALAAIVGPGQVLTDPAETGAARAVPLKTALPALRLPTSSSSGTMKP